MGKARRHRDAPSGEGASGKWCGDRAARELNPDGSPVPEAQYTYRYLDPVSSWSHLDVRFAASVVTSSAAPGMANSHQPPV